ncbi:hypothetical protein RSOLAG1IB_09997 [Rhizoctonia solani AG-1 IB]|uniref:Peptidase C14 caspase domain-containing protein n=1 Tax=Thanatephorus cucumeris (strain AG1-IB / isolate 7/3/14) TaxID=1108050 RepID=A0A0B7FUL4_THACB|nr:hypothetical protein RSOLAG1IB_09997 [Rhizoctonia solani AG-1 IB]
METLETGNSNHGLFHKLGMSVNQRNTLLISDNLPPSLYALIIGINKYPSLDINNLNGAVQDAERFRDYLIRDLRVPRTQITILLDQQATRGEIIAAFQDLGRNPRIKDQDPIVIFYAGHGANLKKPEDWQTGTEYIQALVPHDTKVQDGRGNLVVPLPDRTVAALLNEISSSKGNNITVILDCCHSASATREPTTPGRSARYVPTEVLPQIPPNMDKDIVSACSSDRHAIIAKGFAHRELRSHVLLAACGSDEVAYETGGSGDFTLALLKTLRQYGADKTTYKGCVQRLPTLQRQSPHCEGFHKDRIFFDSKATGANRKLILVKKQGGSYILSAGIAQGIAVGAIFDIFKYDTVDHASDVPLGAMRVISAESLSSTLTWANTSQPFEPPDISYAFQTHCGLDQSINVHFTKLLQSRLRTEQAWHSVFNANSSNVAFIPSEHDTADIIVDTNGDGKAVFQIKHPLIDQYHIERLPQAVHATAKDILAVLRAAALWIWHLNRTSSDNNNIGPKVQIKFARLGESQSNSTETLGEDLNKSGIADFVTHPGAHYGVKLVNGSRFNLYPHLFYFDLNGLSIEQWNDQIVAQGHADASLPRNSFLTIGYGAGGATPLTFETAEDQGFEVGILKLYVTNQPVDFSSIEHRSPFLGAGNTRESLSSTEVSRMLAVRGTWHTVVMTLVQRGAHEVL